MTHSDSNTNMNIPCHTCTDSDTQSHTGTLCVKLRVSMSPRLSDT